MVNGCSPYLKMIHRWLWYSLPRLLSLWIDMLGLIWWLTSWTFLNSAGSQFDTSRRSSLAADIKDTLSRSPVGFWDLDRGSAPCHSITGRYVFVVYSTIWNDVNSTPYIYCYMWNIYVYVYPYVYVYTYMLNEYIWTCIYIYIHM